MNNFLQTIYDDYIYEECREKISKAISTYGCYFNSLQNVVFFTTMR